MKRLIVLLGVLAALALPQGVGAQTTLTLTDQRFVCAGPLAALLAERTAERDSALAQRDECRSKLQRINSNFHSSATRQTRLNRIHNIVHEAGSCAGFTP